MRPLGSYSRPLARPHAPPRALESLTDIITLYQSSGWTTFTYHGHSDLPQSPGRMHNNGRASVRMVEHARHVMTAQYCSARGAPSHKAALPLTAVGYVTQHALRCDHRDACRASTSHTHTCIARPHAMRPSRPPDRALSTLPTVPTIRAQVARLSPLVARSVNRDVGRPVGLSRSWSPGLTFSSLVARMSTWGLVARLAVPGPGRPVGCSGPWSPRCPTPPSLVARLALQDLGRPVVAAGAWSPGCPS